MMVLAITAILLAVTIPYLAEVIDPGDEAAETIRTLARQTRADAIDAGEARWLSITPSGLARFGENGTTADLPDGWAIQVKRFGENRFRKPAKREIWEFNSEGICEPISLKLVAPGREYLVEFDPLTALEPPQI